MKIKKLYLIKIELQNMAQRTGFEPATPGVTGRYSNQLNYRSAMFRLTRLTSR